MLFDENIILYKCTRVIDAHLRRTSVINTENPCLWSKNPVLALKMLKIRKRSLSMAVFWLLSGKNTVKHLTIREK